MDINVTLVIQMLVFMAFVGFTMKFVWPPLSRAMEERQDKIADGLAAAERGRKELDLAQTRVRDELKQAKTQAHEILEKAGHRATQLIEEAKEEARLEAARQMKLAQDQFAQEVSQARASLRTQVADLVVLGAEKILAKEVDPKSNKALLDKLIEEI